MKEPLGVKELNTHINCFPLPGFQKGLNTRNLDSGE